FGGNVTLVHSLVSQHGLADDIADRKDVRHIAAHLLVYFDKTPVGNRYASLLGGDLVAIGGTAHSLQYKVVALRILGRVLAFERYPDSIVACLGADGLGIEHDMVETAGVFLFPDLDHVAVGALHHVAS